MEEQKLSILQRNKINYILRTGESLPEQKKKKLNTRSFTQFDLMRAKNAKRRSLEIIKASGGYDRAKYGYHIFPSSSFLVNIWKTLSVFAILN